MLTWRVHTLSEGATWPLRRLYLTASHAPVSTARVGCLAPSFGAVRAVLHFEYLVRVSNVQ
jgi:hypothetical protein